MKNQNVSVFTDELANFEDDLHIDGNDINQAYCDQPALYAYWATLATKAKNLYERKKFEVEKQENYIKKTLIGELDSKVRMNLEMDGEKITESRVANCIYIDSEYVLAVDEYNKLKEELLDLQSSLSVLEVARESMNQRKDMLISLGAQLRQESNNSEVYIKNK